MTKSIVITGASTGIGYATAKELLANGYHVFASVRKQTDVERLNSEFAQQFTEGKFTALLFDVTDPAAIRSAADQVAQQIGGNGLAGLVNNAGVVVAGPVIHTPVDAYRSQFEVNFFGLIDVTQVFLPLLGAKRDCPHPPGRVINISSVSGRIAAPFLSPYAASKFALEAFTDSLRRELLIYGINVISIQPGPIKTPIWEKYDDNIAEQYAESDFYSAAKTFAKIALQSAQKGQPAEVVARTIRHALEHPQPKTQIALPASWVAWWAAQWLPARWLDRVIAGRMGLKRLVHSG